MTDATNDHLVLICGESGTGKSASLMNLPNQERILYLNCEAGKKLPFKNKFDTRVITDPWQIYEAFDWVQDSPDYDVVVIDTLTFLMDMFESLFVVDADNGQAAWSHYAQYFKNLMQQKIASSDKSVIVLAHTRQEYDEKALSMRVSVPIKGALKNNGLEAYFSTVVATKKVQLSTLENYKSDLLHITEQDQLLEYKHVFQTQLTRDTIGERIRSPMGMFSQQETYMDNDAYALLVHLHEYYN